MRDSNGRILLRNSFMSGIRHNAERHGPSDAVAGEQGYSDMDLVYALPCTSWPQLASHLLEERRFMRWSSNDMIRYAASNGCFVVGVCSKISTFPELEWRISTSLAERCFMFNLNLTQLRCYVLMKIILKTFLNPNEGNGLSSFMCKTVLLRCIENSEHHIWKKSNLSTCLTYCLLELYRSVQNRFCPHFIICENNLMAGQFTIEKKRDLSRKLIDLIQSDGRYLLRLDIDDIGQRLYVKLNRVHQLVYIFETPICIKENCSGILCINLANCINNNMLALENENFENILHAIFMLRHFCVIGNRFEQVACYHFLSFLFLKLGSIMASASIGQNRPLPLVTLRCLFLGWNLDVAFGRLKLASVLYCKGEINNAEIILRQTEERYNTDIVVPLCSCWNHPFDFLHIPAEFKRICSEQRSENSTNKITSCCIRFSMDELHCVPRELQYELMRSTQDDLIYQSPGENIWMQYAIVDSLPFLYFLQYKTYNRLQRHQDQQRALNNLIRTIVTGTNYGHRETALNLLGQCMEQENKHQEALQCYMLSLKQRGRNNAAKFHTCTLLAKYTPR
jgi:tetratricopeptide (TPR) repeat protein